MQSKETPLILFDETIEPKKDVWIIETDGLSINTKIFLNGVLYQNLRGIEFKVNIDELFVNLKLDKIMTMKVDNGTKDAAVIDDDGNIITNKIEIFKGGNI